jgi:hypothetical protein
MSYTFRLRFNISDKVKFPFEETFITIVESEKNKITLRSHKADISIKDTTQLVLRGEGYDTVEEAQAAGDIYRDRLTLTFSKLRFPADFGDRAAKGFWTKYGLEMLKDESGSTVLNDIHGLQVYDSNLNPKFSTVNANAFITKSKETTLEALSAAFSTNASIHEKKRLAFELFSASSFTHYADARFMLLMMALETLIEQSERVTEDQDLICQLINSVKISNISNKASLLSGLNNMRTESIGSAGRRLANNLKDNYMDKPPAIFFTLCYNLRSKLVHGHIPRPTFEEVGGVCAALETFVADLICYPEL